ncbi:Adaptor_protein complex large chain subunit BetaA [Hexamita inflata]|uniref:Adaptor protein complex large chain subunit BetaA n=1 Tax=Hexamita inflata TaxID=28002 RepID=A0AA86PUV2_9EUKA|nr:Adaptor protein complex large chain subunit BetaA [Hexamita inflata]
MAPKQVVVQGFMTSLSLDEIITQLNSREFTENMDGLRNLVGLMSHGVEVDQALPSVIKLVIHPDLSCRRCVYQFLAQYSESNPAQALMAVNILQRALSDKNALVRGIALRALSSIRVREIAEVARLSIEQHVNDESPFVRRIAALGISKLYSFCPEFAMDLRVLLERSLNDMNHLVFGAALQTYGQCFQNDYELLHGCFQKIAMSLSEMDSYQQVNALQILTNYCRANFQDVRYRADSELPMDLHLVYKSVGMLLRTNSPAVVIEAASFFFHCSPAFERQFEVNLVARSIAHAVAVGLVRIATAQYTISQYPILKTIQMISEKHPQFFVPHYKEFYLRQSDTGSDKLVKMHILANIGATMEDAEQDQLLNELKTYISYGMSQVYLEQQEINILVLKVAAKILEVKAQGMLHQNNKLDDFQDTYYVLINASLQRLVQNKNDIAFANDVVFQQSIMEICKLLIRIRDIDTTLHTEAKEQVGEILVSTAQIFLDPSRDEKQDKRYPVPKGIWPGFLGFEQKFDPLWCENEQYSALINKKSLIQVTKLSIFIQEQLRQLISIYQIMNQPVQTLLCVKCKATVIETIAELRHLCSPFVPEFMRRLAVRITDEPFVIKMQTLNFYKEVMAELPLFRAAPVYLKQRRIVQDAKVLKEVEGDEVQAYKKDIIMQRYNGEPEQLTPEQVAEEQSNIDYTIKQMNEYVVKAMQMDQSYVVRDLAALQQFAGFTDEIFALHTDFSEINLILGSVSQVTGIKTEIHRSLPDFAAADTDSSLRNSYNQKPVSPSQLVQQAVSFLPQTTPKAGDKGKKQESFEEESDEDPGITIRGRVDVNDFLNDVPAQKQAPKPKPQKEDSDSYYSEEEDVPKQMQPAQSIPLQMGKKNFGITINPLSVAKVTNQVKVMTVVKPVAQARPVAQVSPQAPVQKQEVKQAEKVQAQPQQVVQQKQPEQKQPEDLMSLFGAPAAKTAQSEPQKKEEKKPQADSGDLLAMLFQ